MTNSQAKSELMQLYGSLSEEKKKAIDTVLNPLSDDDYTELRDRFGTEVESVVRDMISGKGGRWKYMSLSADGEHDGCKDCKHELKSAGEYPCSYCKQNYKDMWEMKNPTDTIPMTREEVYEKLMERYSQGRADEKAYQIG